jgi:hypothetical protein
MRLPHCSVVIPLPKDENEEHVTREQQVTSSRRVHILTVFKSLFTETESSRY